MPRWALGREDGLRLPGPRARAHPRPPLFAFLLTLLSSFGQTFFVALSGAAIRAELGVTDGALGMAYAAATLASGLALGWAGRGIDRVPLRAYAAGVAALLAAGCAGVALAPGLWVLAGAFFLLRLADRGLMSHTAMTATARQFTQDRGKALGIAALGFAVGQAALPPVAVALDAAIGWRSVWWASIGAILLGTLAALRLLPRPRSAASSRPAAGDAGRRRTASAVAPAATPALWRDRRLLLVMPAVLAPSFVTTGLFFHQVRLAEELRWDLGVVAAAFAGFAVARAWAMLRAGPAIDRMGAVRLLPVFLLPLAGAMVAVPLGGGSPAAAVAYLLATGLTSGVTATLTTALWTEFYGVERLGAVRAAAASASVVASALAPAMFGALIDLGVTLRWQAAGCLVYLLAASAVTLPLARRAARPG